MGGLTQVLLVILALPEICAINAPQHLALDFFMDCYYHNDEVIDGFFKQDLSGVLLCHI